MSNEISCGISLLQKRPSLGSVVLAVLVVASSSLSGTQDRSDLRLLEPGRPIKAELAGGETRLYFIPTDSNQYLRIAVVHESGDIAAALFTEPGTKVVELNTRDGVQAPMRLSHVTDRSGVCRLEVRSPEGSSKSAYEVRLEDYHAAAETDRQRVRGDAAFLEAEKARLQGTAQSMRIALERYEEALAFYRAASDDFGTGRTLSGMGRAQDSLGERKKAVDLFNDALALQHSSGDLSGEAYTLNFLALTLEHLGELGKAHDCLERALALARSAGDHRVEGITLNDLGLIYLDQGEKRTALDYYRRALPFHQLMRNLRGEATTLSNIGQVLDGMGEKRKALDYMMPALELERIIGDPKEEARMLNNIGAVYGALDESTEAIEFYNQALSLWRSAGDRSGEAATLHNIAGIYANLGEYQKALDFFQQVLPLERADSFRAGEANTLNNIGQLYQSLGDLERSAGFYREALPLHRAVGNRSGEAITLTNLGRINLTTDDRAQALQFLEQALTLHQAVGNRNWEANTYSYLGDLFLSTGETAKAEDAYLSGLELQRSVGSRRGEATALNEIGGVAAAAGEHERAIAQFSNALELFHSIGDVRGEAATLSFIAGSEMTHGNLRAARDRQEKAIEIAETIRGKVFSPDLRSSYLASVLSYYKRYVEILMRLHRQFPAEGYDAAALQASERARARSLIETLIEAGVDVRGGADPVLLDQERVLAQRLNLRAERRTQLLSGPHSVDQAQDAAREIENLTAELDAIRAGVRASSPRYAALTQPQPVSIREMQQLLDPDTLLLEYAIGQERSFLWAVTSRGIASYELPDGRAIESASKDFYEQLKANAPTENIVRAAKGLSAMLLSPVSAELAKKKLLIVAEGALQYVPFGALDRPAGAAEEPSGCRRGLPSRYCPMVLAHEIVHLPSATSLAVLRRETAGRPPAPKSLAVFADPVFRGDDSRVRSTAGPGNLNVSYSRLIQTRREADAILALAPANERKRAVDFDASRRAAMSPELSRYRIVHFATHAVLDSSHPELSGVVLSMVNEQGLPQDGFLRLHEIYNLKLPAELVVLSACETALGKEIKGEGLVGLTRGFMYAGARRIAASLWEVDDKATAELMQRFYQGMLGNSQLTPAAAMRAAQIAVLEQKQWQSPYYWAAFTLQGEYQ